MLFHKNIAEFQELGIEVELKKNRYYHGEEFVADKYLDRLGELCIKYSDLKPFQAFMYNGEKEKDKHQGDYAIPAAHCAVFHSKGIMGGIKKHVHILHVMEYRSELEKTFAKGHEQTHALHQLDHIDEFEKALEEFGVQKKYDKTMSSDENEVMANMGGILACLRSDCNLKDIENYVHKHMSAELARQTPFNLFRT